MSEQTERPGEHSPGEERRNGEESALAGIFGLLLDVGVPITCYYVLSKGAGLSVMASLAWSSVMPAARTSWSVFVRRSTNRFALAVLVVTLVGLVLSLWTGDARLMLAKDSGATAALSIVVLISTLRGAPLMSAALRPWLVRGDAERGAAWDRLSASPGRFRTAERRYSVVWGLALLTECVLRVIGAYTLPVDFMVWFGTVILGACVAVAVAVSGPLATKPMEKMITAEAGARTTESGASRR
ncbi:VC0807 family protein [Streptomyces winkii]|uniref:VC0807 family protein n=1 Tax=Streptomyces winkii TaxID=3051178 RepID=UPI0028D7F208|nr:VC0807 family protein [Streptomyces sp. DSM 40971]